LFKRVKNITKDFDGQTGPYQSSRLVEPAEVALVAALDAKRPAIEQALARDAYAEAMRELSGLSAPVDRFFVDVLVMAEDRSVREARLGLLAYLRRTILSIADIAEIAPDQT
jgi:glycyl-tRNA synthetase beta chain